MNYKYGTFKEEQFKQYKKRIHSLIHWLLIYAENVESKEIEREVLGNYFIKVQYKLAGLNSLINYPSQLIEIMGLVESAKLEFFDSKNYSHTRYRKIILDIHELIDELPEGDSYDL